jgi:hypothetical protein
LQPPDLAPRAGFAGASYYRQQSAPAALAAIGPIHLGLAPDGLYFPLAQRLPYALGTLLISIKPFSRRPNFERSVVLIAANGPPTVWPVLNKTQPHSAGRRADLRAR